MIIIFAKKEIRETYIMFNKYEYSLSSINNSSEKNITICIDHCTCINKACNLTAEHCDHEKYLYIIK
jgi:hypothetical protein